MCLMVVLEAGRRRGEKDDGSQEADGMQGMHMEMNDLTPIAKTVWIALSFALLVFAMWLTARWVPIQFS